MTIYCEKCKLPLKFVEIPEGQGGAGKLMPVSAKGGNTWDTKVDHWDECREEYNKISGITPERQAELDQIACPPMRTNPNRLKSFYNGDCPPWEYPSFIMCYDRKNMIKKE